MLRNLFSVLAVLILFGCGKKAPKPDPAVVAAMQATVTCAKCSHTATRVTFKRINQVLVQCPKCQKAFPAVKKAPKSKKSRK